MTVEQGPSQIDLAEQEYQNALKTLSPERAEVVKTLSQKEWYKKTEPTLRQEIVTLPPNHDGFVQDLCMRPDQFDGVKVERMQRLPRGNFGLIPVFELDRKTADGKNQTYEYFTWRTGPESGAKGLVFVKGKDGKLSHFIVLRADKFAPGKQAWDLAGGFGEKDDKEKGPFATIRREVGEEFGIKDVKIESTMSLGKILPDAGQTNNNPEVFALVIDSSEATKINENNVNLDPHELKGGPVVIPMSQLGEFSMQNQDSFFHFAKSKLTDLGLLPQPTVTPQKKLINIS